MISALTTLAHAPRSSASVRSQQPTRAAPLPELSAPSSISAIALTLTLQWQVVADLWVAGIPGSAAR
jgi:hypothetical protein